MAAGGFVVWDLASAVARTAEMVTEAQRMETSRRSGTMRSGL